MTLLLSNSISLKSSVPLHHSYQMTYNTIDQRWRKIKRLLDQHTDAISSIGILAVTTAVLASKIFRSLPVVVGRSGRLFLEFCGIIWLNVQLKEFSKCGRDCLRAIQSTSYSAIARTAIKVIIKGVNVLLTCAYFGASVSSFGGFPHISTMIYTSLRPLSLAILSIEIVNEIGDYMTNRKLLEKLNLIENESNASNRLLKIVKSFFEINEDQKIYQSKTTHIDANQKNSNERKLAETLVRQLDFFTLSTIKEIYEKNSSSNEDRRIKALRLYFQIKDGLSNIHARVKSNLNLTVLGYLSRGICKMYPDSLTEMTVRWGMSVLYTDELVIKYKLRQMDLNGNT